MTTRQAVDIFNVIQDKYGSPDIIEDEAVDYLNMAINEWMNRLIPDSQGGVVNFDFDSNTAAIIKPLIYELNATMVGQIVSDEALADLLHTATDDDCSEVFRIMSVGIDVTSGLTTTTYPVKYVKHNNFWIFQRNAFKKATSTTPLYTIVNNGYKFHPTQAGTVRFTVIKKPRVLALNPKAIDPEFDDYTMTNVIFNACKIAGIGTRDGELIEDIRLAGLQISN
jgi:hypothetical protein